MENNKRIERPSQVIKARVTPVSESTKQKIKNAFQDVINRIKQKHLS